MKLFSCLIAAVGCVSCRTAWCDVLVHPYLQNPSSTAMSIYWVTDTDEPGRLTIEMADGTQPKSFTSTPEQKSELNYGPSELSALPGGKAPGFPYVHRVRVEGLQPGTTYAYTVMQGASKFEREFQTAPGPESGVRFIVYADSETEPESTGNAVDWPAPFSGKKKRRYVVDQTEGYRQNLKVIQSREPDFIAIAGDLVEKGGRQLDWDEFWKHNAGEISDVAGSIPILAAVGNHENYAGSDGGYTVQGARRGIGKFQTYFETPDNGSGNPAFQDRYYRVDYGPIAFITLDCTNGLPDKSPADTNFMLLGEGEGGDAPDFNPGSTQYQWLETQLADAQSSARFIFVSFHHMPFSVGPHGLPAGSSDGEDTQSGQPVRVLAPLFEKYGVDAVFCGHDEFYENAVVNGIHYYDLGMGGDGLRGPTTGKDGSSGLPSSNPYQVFLAHLDAPEIWDGHRLIDGGKHYGHLEVSVAPDGDSRWTAALTPVYVFPIMDESGQVTGWERRVYDDEVVLHAE